MHKWERNTILTLILFIFYNLKKIPIFQVYFLNFHDFSNQIKEPTFPGFQDVSGGQTPCSKVWFYCFCLRRKRIKFCACEKMCSFLDTNGRKKVKWLIKAIYVPTIKLLSSFLLKIFKSNLTAEIKRSTKMLLTLLLVFNLSA